jgi:hypothetical protein
VKEGPQELLSLQYVRMHALAQPASEVGSAEQQQQINPMHACDHLRHVGRQRRSYLELQPVTLPRA